MTADQPRCEPPEGWRERDGWHWVQWPAGPPPFTAYWWCGPQHFVASGVILGDGYRYLAPVTPPNVVRGLVEALRHIAWGSRDPEASDIARAALAAYRANVGDETADRHLSPSEQRAMQRALLRATKGGEG